MPHEHCFVEPFIEGSCDLRIQRIGEHVRAFRRRDIAGEWKTNTGTSIVEEVPCEERWRAWYGCAPSACERARHRTRGRGPGRGRGAHAGFACAQTPGQPRPPTCSAASTS